MSKPSVDLNSEGNGPENKNAVIVEELNEVRKVHRVFIIGSIDSDEDWYRPLLDLLHKKLPENDTIEIVMNSYGGNLYDALQIISAIDNSPNKVHLKVEGYCASAATLITLIPKYDDLYIDDLSSFLFHTASFLAYGKVPDVKDKTAHVERLVETLFNNNIQDVLSKSEIETILNGKEFYLLGSDVNKRLESNAKRKK